MRGGGGAETVAGIRRCFVLVARLLSIPKDRQRLSVSSEELANRTVGRIGVGGPGLLQSVRSEERILHRGGGREDRERETERPRRPGRPGIYLERSTYAQIIIRRRSARKITRTKEGQQTQKLTSSRVARRCRDRRPLAAPPPVAQTAGGTQPGRSQRCGGCTARRARARLQPPRVISAYWHSIGYGGACTGPTTKPRQHAAIAIAATERHPGPEARTQPESGG